MPEGVIAAVKVREEVTELREFPVPVPAPDAGLLRVESCGVGGSDPETYRRAGHAPVIMGHEIVGTIVAAGPVATARWGCTVGDRVALQEYLPCWQCDWCRQGDFRLCEVCDFFNVRDALRTPRFGMSTSDVAPHLWGGFAQFVHLPANALMHRVPDGLSSRQATLAIPFANGIQWTCLDGGATHGKSVLVFGPGQQGLGCVAAARSVGASLIIVAGMARDATRLKLAERLGADVAIDVGRTSVRDTVLERTGGRGIDVVVDTTGDPDGHVVAEALASARKGACLSLNGLAQQVPIREIKRQYLTVKAPRGRSHRAMEQALSCLASLDADTIAALCSHDFALAQVHEAILATAGRGAAGAVHVTVDPWKAAA